MCFWRLLAWPLRPAFPSLNTERQPGNLQGIAPSARVTVGVESSFVWVVVEGEIVAAGDVSGRDCGLGEQPVGASSITASTVLTLLAMMMDTWGVEAHLEGETTLLSPPQVDGTAPCVCIPSTAKIADDPVESGGV